MDDLAALDKCISYTLNDTEPNARSQLNNLRRDNLNKIIFAHLNINSIRNKFDQLADLVKGKIDILMISESKIDDSFPDSQFFLDGYSKPMISIEKLPIESFLIELNLKKEVAY